MIKNLMASKGWKKLLIVIAVILSYAIAKFYTPMSLYAASGFWLSSLFVIGYGVFSWLLFELLIGFFYSGLKNKIEKHISMNEFTNLFRVSIIPLNLISFGVLNLLMAINFLTPFFYLVVMIVLSFAWLWIMYKFLIKHFLQSFAGKEFSLTYFSFVFIYLFLMTIMWGSV